MAFKKFFSISGHCFKMLKSVRSTIQKKLRKRNKIDFVPITVDSVQNRESVSTEITLLEYENPPYISSEVSENEFNESVEKHWRHCKRILYSL